MPYRRTWSKTFKSTEFKDPEVPPLRIAPIRCPEHPDRGFKAYSEWWMLPTEGTWRLRVPINVKSVMPGEKQKILSLNIKGLYRVWNAISWEAGADIILYGDNVEIFRYNGLSHGNNKWVDNPLTVNRMIDNINNLDIALHQLARSHLTGSVEIHDADITISCEYYTTEPPGKGDVEVIVIDAQKRTPLRNINVRIMAGTRVVRDGYTDRTGKVLFKNIDEGSYVLHIAGIPPTYWSGGYQGLDLEITVEPDVLNSYTAELPPLSRIPLPWYVYAGVAAGAIGGIYLITRPKPAPPVVVVK